MNTSLEGRYNFPISANRAKKQIAPLPYFTQRNQNNVNNSNPYIIYQHQNSSTNLSINPFEEGNDHSYNPVSKFKYPGKVDAQTDNSKLSTSLRSKHSSNMNEYPNRNYKSSRNEIVEEMNTKNYKANIGNKDYMLFGDNKFRCDIERYQNFMECMDFKQPEKKRHLIQESHWVGKKNQTDSINNANHQAINFHKSSVSDQNMRSTPPKNIKMPPLILVTNVVDDRVHSKDGVAMNNEGKYDYTKAYDNVSTLEYNTKPQSNFQSHSLSSSSLKRSTSSPSSDPPHSNSAIMTCLSADKSSLPPSSTSLASYSKTTSAPTSISSSSSAPPLRSSNGTSKSTAKPDQKQKGMYPMLLPPCRICGSKASGFHYGVNSCEACKGFFRRALKKPMLMECRKNNKCNWKRSKRNSCRFCRFKRCLSMGMSKGAIKTGRYSHQKRTKDIIEVKQLQSCYEKNSDIFRGGEIIENLVYSHDKLIAMFLSCTESTLLEMQTTYLSAFLEHHKSLQTGDINDKTDDKIQMPVKNQSNESLKNTCPNNALNKAKHFPNQNFDLEPCPEKSLSSWNENSDALLSPSLSSSSSTQFENPLRSFMSLPLSSRSSPVSSPDSGYFDCDDKDSIIFTKQNLLHNNYNSKSFQNIQVKSTPVITFDSELNLNDDKIDNNCDKTMINEYDQFIPSNNTNNCDIDDILRHEIKKQNAICDNMIANKNETENIKATDLYSMMDSESDDILKEIMKEYSFESQENHAESLTCADGTRISSFNRERLNKRVLHNSIGTQFEHEDSQDTIMDCSNSTDPFPSLIGVDSDDLNRKYLELKNSNLNCNKDPSMLSKCLVNCGVNNDLQDNVINTTSCSDQLNDLNNSMSIDDDLEIIKCLSSVKSKISQQELKNDENTSCKAGDGSKTSIFEALLVSYENRLEVNPDKVSTKTCKVDNTSKVGISDKCRDLVEFKNCHSDKWRRAKGLEKEIDPHLLQTDVDVNDGHCVRIDSCRQDEAEKKNGSENRNLNNDNGSKDVNYRLNKEEINENDNNGCNYDKEEHSTYIDDDKEEVRGNNTDDSDNVENAKSSVKDGAKFWCPLTTKRPSGSRMTNNEISEKKSGLSRNDTNQVWTAENMLQQFVTFARAIPGFSELPIEDQSTLLKNSWDEVWILGAYWGFNSELGVAVMSSGKTFHIKEMEVSWGQGYVRLAFDLSDMLKKNDLQSEVLVLLKAICIVSADRCSHLQEREKVEKVHWQLIHCLMNELDSSIANSNVNFPRLVDILTSLRRLGHLANENSLFVGRNIRNELVLPF